MGKGTLTLEEQNILKNNPFVERVTSNRVYYSYEFKSRFIRSDLKGEKIGKIFRNAGFNVKILGSKRIERAAARWRELYQNGEIDI